MKIESRKCDICSRMEHGAAIDSWMACAEIYPVKITGSLREVGDYLNQHLFRRPDGSEIKVVETCSFNCLVRALRQGLTLTPVEVDEGESEGRLVVARPSPAAQVSSLADKVLKRAGTTATVKA